MPSQCLSPAGDPPSAVSSQRHRRVLRFQEPGWKVRENRVLWTSVHREAMVGGTGRYLREDRRSKVLLQGTLRPRSLQRGRMEVHRRGIRIGYDHTKSFL